MTGQGRDSGAAWSWAVDLSAVLMTPTSPTGIWLLLHLEKRRATGLWTVLASAATVATVYWLGVP